MTCTCTCTSTASGPGSSWQRLAATGSDRPYLLPGQDDTMGWWVGAERLTLPLLCFPFCARTRERVAPHTRCLLVSCWRQRKPSSALLSPPHAGSRRCASSSTGGPLRPAGRWRAVGGEPLERPPAIRQAHLTRALVRAVATTRALFSAVERGGAPLRGASFKPARPCASQKPKIPLSQTPLNSGFGVYDFSPRRAERQIWQPRFWCRCQDYPAKW